MTTIHQAHQILESLDALDQAQTEKVMNYIRALTHPSRDDAGYQRWKREAMKEIRQALGEDRKPHLSF